MRILIFIFMLTMTVSSGWASYSERLDPLLDAAIDIITNPQTVNSTVDLELAHFHRGGNVSLYGEALDRWAAAKVGDAYSLSAYLRLLRTVLMPKIKKAPKAIWIQDRIQALLNTNYLKEIHSSSEKILQF